MAFFAFLSWFRPWWKTAETDYETVLARLTTDITSVQDRLVRVRQRERRVSVTLTAYAVVAWIAYAAFVWLATAGERAHMARHERLRLWAPVGVGLVVILSLRYIVRWWYRRVSAGEEKHLRSLQSTRRKKIDEIKAATRYDHLRNLLERYDDTATRRPGSSRNVSRTMVKGAAAGQSTGSASQAAAKPGVSPPAQVQQQQSTRAKGGEVNDPAIQAPVERVSSGTGTPKSLTAQEQPSTRTSIPAAQSATESHVEKTFLDRVADKILGVDPSSQANGPEQQYALICQVCFNHNGLCAKEDWDEVQYICPRCGTFNSRRPSSRPVSSVWGLSSAHQQGLGGGGSGGGFSMRESSPSESVHAAFPQNQKPLEAEADETQVLADSSVPSSPAPRVSCESAERTFTTEREEPLKDAHAGQAEDGEDGNEGSGTVRRRLVDGHSGGNEAMQID